MQLPAERKPSSRAHFPAIYFSVFKRQRGAYLTWRWQISNQRGWSNPFYSQARISLREGAGTLSAMSMVSWLAKMYLRRRCSKEIYHLYHCFSASLLQLQGSSRKSLWGVLWRTTLNNKRVSSVGWRTKDCSAWRAWFGFFLAHTLIQPLNTLTLPWNADCAHWIFSYAYQSAVYKWAFWVFAIF